MCANRSASYYKSGCLKDVSVTVSYCLLDQVNISLFSRVYAVVANNTYDVQHVQVSKSINSLTFIIPCHYCGS